ncbi:MAG: hypothetical protein QN122_13055 [Armatimonadota bacterium]|nr:hypothetical protein [Armatimonadota bacterium]MDR7528907.1 hypothetical protein [Armatimonadota bacterium]
MTAAFAGCVRVGTLPGRGQTFRCSVPASVLAPGRNFLSVVLDLSDGSQVGQTVTYDVELNTEP